MSEITVKVYGMFEMSKKAYLSIQSIGALMLAAGIAAWFAFDLAAHSNIFLKYLMHICVAILVLETIETVVMLRKYKQKELAGSATS